MRDIIISTKEDFIFKKKLYDEIEIKNVIKRDIDLFIFEENILIKEFDNIKKVKEITIEKIVKDEYGDESDILIHYEYDKKKKKLYLYSMGNGSRVKKLSRYVKDIRVNPVQFYIKNIVENKIKKLLNYIIIFNLRDKVYSIYIKEGFIIKSFIKDKDKFILDNELSNLDKDVAVVIGEEEKNMISQEVKSKLNIITFEIGEIINEKLFKI